MSNIEPKFHSMLAPFTDESLFNDICTDITDQERREICEHLLHYLNEVKRVYIEQMDNSMKQNHRISDAEKLIVDFKGNIRKRATKPRPIQRRHKEIV
jgi:hypothetical protein